MVCQGQTGKVICMAPANAFKSLSKQKKILIACALAAVIVSAAVVCIMLVRSKYLATTMRLLRVEGSVSNRLFITFYRQDNEEMYFSKILKQGDTIFRSA